MKIRVHSSDIQAMMKTIRNCINGKIDHGNIEVRYGDNALSIRGTNGSVSGMMSMPMMGGDGETFRVDGEMFDRVCGQCSGEIVIETDEHACTVRGAGRTRLPFVAKKIPEMERVSGTAFSMGAADFRRLYEKVKHAIATDGNRMVLTGVLMSGDGMGKLTMVALDGFQMSTETAGYEGEEVKIVVPGTFAGMIAKSVGGEEKITFTTDGMNMEAATEGMRMRCALLTGEYPGWERILPGAFRTECLVKIEQMMSALKSGMVVQHDRFLVKMRIGEKRIVVMSNSQVAEFCGDVECDTQGDTGLDIAFNAKYLMAALGTMDGDTAVMKFNSGTTPVTLRSGEGEGGIRLVLPVRVFEG